MDPAEQTLSLRAIMSCSSFCSGGGVADASHLNIMCAQVRVALPSISDVVNQVCPACVQRKNKPS